MSEQEKRPSIYCQEVRDLVTEDALPKVLEWLRAYDEGDPAFNDPEEMEHLKKQVARAVERGYYDGYDTATYLRDNGWEVDGELVDVFEGVLWKSYNHHETIVAQWVARNAITPEFSIGDKVAFRDEGKDCEGVVKEIRTKTAQYMVFCESLGHGVRKGGVTRLGTYVPFEEAKRAS